MNAEMAYVNEAREEGEGVGGWQTRPLMRRVKLAMFFAPLAHTVKLCLRGWRTGTRIAFSSMLEFKYRSPQIRSVMFECIYSYCNDDKRLPALHVTIGVFVYTTFRLLVFQ